VRPPSTLVRITLAALLALVVGAGCAYFSRVGECRRLAVRVNGALDEIAAVHDAGGATAATYLDMADRYARLAGEVKGFSGRDDPLGKTLVEYSQAFEETSRSLRALAQALEKQDTTAAARVRRELVSHTRRDRTLVARVDGLCREP
jgi:hypothetical protein